MDMAMTTTTPSQSHSQPLPVILLLLFLLLSAAIPHLILEAAAAEQDEQQAITLADCPNKCGNMSIPYPFGMKPGCFRQGFQVTCNYSFDHPRAYLANSEQRTQQFYDSVKVEWYRQDWDRNITLDSTALELIDISVEKGEARVYGAVSSVCNSNSTDYISKCHQVWLGEEMGPFLLSATRNVLIGVGWRVHPMINSNRWLLPNVSNDFTISCLSEVRGLPEFLKFATNGSCSGQGSCPAKGKQPPPDYACSGNSSCANATSGQGYVCKCWDDYEGNPYITNGCQDIDECKLRDSYPCSSDGVCKNKLGGYDCPCKPGMKGDGKTGNCTDKVPLAERVILGGIGGIFFMAVLSFLILLRKEKRKTREFYEKNGGRTLEEAKFIKLFKKEKLKPILKSSNFIGKGGFGEVYKGILDNEQVAVKKPISGSVLENEQFANEVIIQSQVIHKNIVRLIGCCLEVDLPILVYEFLSNGSLDDILHGNNKVPLNLGVRLSIATESADGLVYMHSKTNTKILHGDVKPANILLDDKFVPKISDFGMSRLIARDKQHTGSIIGDMSYVDPVYLQTGLLTEKSDVYSFGVVILELISRKKATHSDGGSLVNNFLEAYKKEKEATQLFDKEIAVTEDLEILGSLAGIAVECLNLDVDQRPWMTDVAERLLKMDRSRKSQFALHNPV
ncbi:wall-associated receptor kinase 1-like isoform X1 [Triticum dicoccoides]|uniref:wall-associated receptor kinase 1-like isoform X1 n=1 Tax=Triticum dicoccoides TaxID=85692 RepID=UPI001891A72D|nr:wall-associated receptor kinase 1-like isoform X1 [Triticum dicoccoides]